MVWNAKQVLSVVILLLCTATGFAQGTIQFGNTFGTGATGFRAPIYGGHLNNITESLMGNSALGNPLGTTVYAGPLVQGTGFTMALFAGPAGSTEGELTLVTATTFRTATGNVLPAGLINTVTVPIQGVASGQIATLQIRVWDNQGGTITSWEHVLAMDGQNGGPWTQRGKAALFLSAPLGGMGATPPESRGGRASALG